MDSRFSFLESEHSKRNTNIANKSNLVNVSDASCQANIAYEVITYDSDDEMVKSRRGIPFGGLRNKKGHPIYSREDIREQYCITRKELDVLEQNLGNSSAARLFGCLSSRDMPDSQCNKNSFLLLSCVHKRKNSSNLMKHSDCNKSLQHLKSESIANKSEEEESDGGFRQHYRPYSETLSGNKQKYNHFSNDLRDNKQISAQNIGDVNDSGLKSNYSRSKVRLHQSYSTGSQDTNRSSVKSSIYPSQETPYNSSTMSQTSHSADELSIDHTSGQQQWSSQDHSSRTGDVTYDISSKKHVSFDSGDTSKVRRSVTLGASIAAIPVTSMSGGVRQHLARNASPPSISLTSVSSTRKDMSPPVASQERLLGTKLCQSSEKNVVSRHRSLSPSQSYTPSLSTPCRLVRRVIMKTQSTQTDVTGLTKSRSSHSIPAYLTLSPRRANNQHRLQRRSFDLRVPTTPISLCEYHQKLILRQANSWAECEAEALGLPLMKSHSDHGFISANEFNDEVMQVFIDGNYQTGHSSESKFRDIPPYCDNHINQQPYEPFLQTVKLSVKSYSNDEVFIPKRQKDIEGEGNILDGCLVRRHSANADLAAEPLGCVPIASPPPGFGDPIEVFTESDVNISNDKEVSNIELSPKKSNSESSHAMITDDGSDLVSSTTTDMDDLQSSANNSKMTTSSPTVVSELNPDVPLTPPLMTSENIDNIPMDSPISRLKKQLMDTLLSPESESSSFHTTSSTNSAPEMSSDKSEEVLCAEVCGESEIQESIDKTASPESDQPLSHDSSFSPFDMSSTRTVVQRKSDPNIDDNEVFYQQEGTKTRSLSVPIIKRPTSFQSKRPLLRSDETFDDRKSSSSSEASIHIQSPHSPESIASTHYSTNVEDVDSELQDLTPIAEVCSSDPSTTVEPTTVVESTSPAIKPTIPPKPSYLCKQTVDTLLDIELEVTSIQSDKEIITEEPNNEEPNTNTTDDDVDDDFKSIIHKKLLDFNSKSEELSKSIVSESEENVDNNEENEDNIYFGPILRRSLSGELSTVSEVSEEMSATGFGLQNTISSYERESFGPVLTLSADGVSSENIAIHSGATSPSLADSTTSGSFMIDASVTEPTSGSESNRVTIGKAGSLPCIPTQTMTNVTKVASEGGVGVDTIPRKTKTESTITTDLEINESTPKRYEPIVGQLIDLTTESSQATEKDIEKSEFSLQHQSSQDIDEESLSFDALNHSFSLKDGHEELQQIHIEEDMQEIEVDSQGLALLQELSTSESTTTQHLSDIKKSSIHSDDEKQLSKSIKHKKRSHKTVSTNQRNSSSESHTLLSQEELYIMQRRARSLSRSPEKGFDSKSPTGHYFQSCSHHHFTCSQCGESANKHIMPSILKRSRLERTGIPYLYRKSMTIDDIYFSSDEDEEDAGVHTDSYRSALWVYIGHKEEIAVWGHRNPLHSCDDKSLSRSESDESTLSEKGFKKHYEAITHRLIHRKASIEMYKRILNRTFAIEKTLTIVKSNGEFGFRIHGSKPVVVSAIEKGTPAEINGLEVGDIIVTVNECNVLEASHSDVVKLAHTGSDTLKIEVICTSKSIKKNQPPVEHDIIMNGYLSRLTDKLADKEKVDHKTKSDANSQSDGTNKFWRRRWFVLKSDYCLYWYKTANSTEPMGAISLQGYCAGVYNESLFGQSFVFRLIRYASSHKFFAANDNETVGQWVYALNQSATHINQIDPYIDSTLHNIHKNPLSLKHLDCYGYLSKFSKRRKVWRHRYFVLKDACLYFYADANSNTALGVFYLHGYKVQACPMIGKKHTFEVIPPDPKMRYIWLLSESDADKKRWLAALEYSIDRWIKLK